MKKNSKKFKKNQQVKNVDNQEEKLYLNKFVVKNYLMDNQRKLKLDQNEYCALNYLVNISKVKDWSGSYPLVHLEIDESSAIIGAEVSEILGAVKSLEKKNFIASVNKHRTYSLLPLGLLLTPHLSADIKGKLL